MLRYSMAEIKTAISELCDFVDCYKMKGVFLLLGFCYSEEELHEINCRIDRRILELSKK